MQQFAHLYQQLERSTATLDKRAALVAYFQQADPADAAWALWLLVGNKVSSARRKLATSTELRQWVSERSGTPLWLVEDSYHHVGDLAETLTLLLNDPPVQQASDTGLAQWIEHRLLPVANTSEAQRREVIEGAWSQLPMAQRLVFNKLLTGSLRVGVSRASVQQALAHSSGVPIARIAQRMLGAWEPTPQFLQRLFSDDAQDADVAAPYPFFLASPLEQAPAQLGAVADWLLEWKWDGIRLQIIRRNTVVALWSRGEERLDGRFPEIEAAALQLPQDAVIDGELLAWQDGAPLPFTVLQKRIQRLKPSARMQEQAPVGVLAYDLLELAGRDLRELPLAERRALLEQLLAQQGPEGLARLQLSPAIAPQTWEEAAVLRTQARERGVEGFMLKRQSSTYQMGRKRGDWWKWKVEPLTIDAVLLYAQAGHGRRSNLYTDYTFGLWDGDKLVPVAKAYSGLDDREIAELDRWVRAHTVERFGPVRSVQPFWVFELGFEGVNSSARHKSGVAVRFPRILRWRRDKTAAQADTLAALQALA